MKYTFDNVEEVIVNGQRVTPISAADAQLNISEPSIRTRLQNLFLDYFNNFLSVEGFASYYGLDDDRAARVIKLGRKIHEDRVRRALR